MVEQEMVTTKEKGYISDYMYVYTQFILNLKKINDTKIMLVKSVNIKSNLTRDMYD